MTSETGVSFSAGSTSLLAAWNRHQVGGGVVEVGPAGIALHNPPTPAGYCNAQIDDYAAPAGQRYRFRHTPPLRLTVTAYAAGETVLRGTAGFGLWNHPFSPDARRLALPRAAWFFFASPPSDLQLAAGAPGRGWKAATLDATRPQALRLIPLALPALLAFQVPALRRRWYPPVQRALAIHEAPLDAALLRQPHTYTLEWRASGVRFAVDDAEVLHTPAAPRRPMGLVLWIDNQYAVVSPTGRLGGGVLPLPAPQTLHVQQIRLETLEDA